MFFPSFKERTIMNILESIARNLGFGQLQKIDPNTQQVSSEDPQHGTASIGQAAVPAVLLGIFNKLDENQDTTWLTGTTAAGNWMNVIFGAQAKKVAERIVAYARVSENSGAHDIEHIAAESVRVVKDFVAGKSASEVSAFVAANRNLVLLHLPASLEIGKLLQNNNLDDRTNKMEGPVSSFMHKLEGQFNSSENS
jgi:hypothetical protein